MRHPVQDNPLQCRADVELAAMQMIEPLYPYLSKGRAGLHLGDTGAVYPQEVADMEGFSRVLWAIVPMLAGACQSVAPAWRKWRVGIRNGTDPAHPEYWGDIGTCDQRMVEMAVMGIAMCLIPDAFFFAYPKAVQRRIHAWLSQINLHDMPVNNWRFFRVLVNTGFRLCGLPFSEERLAEDFALIEEHYEDNGWYYDYPDQREYYTPWAYHYYGLIYALVMDRHDPERCEVFRERARLFAPRFACWFDQNGHGLPYGRSLTYRFAQSAFWSAMALAGVTAPGIGWGELKGFVLRNLRFWLKKPIFKEDGVLSIGYGYPNLMMAEGYNAPGSPYWAFKAFAILALPGAHPFWTAKEAPYMPPPVLPDTHARALIVRNESGSHVQAFSAGNHSWRHMLDEAKYEKFVYSTHFAFSVPKGLHFLHRGAFDCMLAFSEDDVYWHPRYGCESFSIEENRVKSTWNPFRGVRVRTEIYPVADWHVRIHRIASDRRIHAAEGGFAIRSEQEKARPEIACEDRTCRVDAPWGISAIWGVRGYERAEALVTEPNTNVLYPRTLLPTLHADIPAGETLLCCVVLGGVPEDNAIPTQIPKEVMQYVPMD